MTSPKTCQLIQWCTTNAIYISNRLKIQETEQGIAVYAVEDIDVNDIVVKIPRYSILSLRTCLARNSIAFELYGLPAQMALSLALYIELTLGSSSNWYGYLQSLPPLVDLPVFWFVDELRTGSMEDHKVALGWIQGTELEKVMQHSSNLLSDLRLYFENNVLQAFLRHVSTLGIAPVFRKFCYAFSLVSSRAFVVDTYNGLCMVPIADAFNHTYENHVHLESDFYVCPVCGSVSECEHDDGRSTTEVDVAESYDMITNALVSSASEVFNTYGENLTNSQLLCQYGFILDENENDHITFDITVPSQPMSDDSLVCAYSHLINTETSGATIDADGRVSAPLFMHYASGHSDEITSSLEGLEGDSSPSFGITRIAQELIDLCDSRLKEHIVPNDPELFDSLPPCSRMVYTLATSERAVLQSCRSSWMEVLSLSD